MNIPQQITMRACGFSWSLQITGGYKDGYYKVETLLQTVSITSFGQDVSFQIGPYPFETHPDDLLALASYLEDHMAALANHKIEGSPTFLQRELGFQLQALFGEVELPDQGEFTVQVMLPIGKESGGANVYSGLEGGISVEEAQAFITRLRNLVASEKSKDSCTQ